jgi:hypothetical protein
MFNAPYRLICTTLSHSARSVSEEGDRRVPSGDVRQTIRWSERRDGRGDLVAIGDVDPIRLRLSAPCGCFSRARLVEIENPQHAAFFRQTEGGGTADAARATGQDHPPSIEPAHAHAE